MDAVENKSAPLRNKKYNHKSGHDNQKGKLLYVYFSFKHKSKGSRKRVE